MTADRVQFHLERQRSCLDMAQRASSPTIRRLHEQLARTHKAMAAVEAEKPEPNPTANSTTFEILSQVFAKVPDTPLDLPERQDLLEGKRRA